MHCELQSPDVQLTDLLILSVKYLEGPKSMSYLIFFTYINFIYYLRSKEYLWFKKYSLMLKKLLVLTFLIFFNLGG